MTCEGCVNAVTRVLGKFSGLKDFKTDLAEKKVYVTTAVEPEEVLTTLQKTGKKCSYIGIKE